jgi:hypothetical protein
MVRILPLVCHAYFSIICGCVVHFSIMNTHIAYSEYCTLPTLVVAETSPSVCVTSTDAFQAFE